MKRIIVLLLALMLFLCGCDSAAAENRGETLGLANADDCVDLEVGLFDDGNDDGFFIGSWLSYIELMEKNCDGGEESYASYIGKIADNLKKAGVTDLFVQVRPFCDAIYPSKLAVSSHCVASTQGEKLKFDYFSVIIEEAKKRDIKVHAWINPFRVQTEFDLDKLSDENIAKKWYMEKSDNVKEAAGGLYLCPASVEVQHLIIDVVREILENYDVAGIHIDDYFYPTTDESFDKAFYEKYKSENGKLSLLKWRRENVSALVSGIYSAVKTFGEDKIFSISPCADTDKNENELYADVKLWAGQSGYCDMIIPQIYFGFENESKPFEDCALSWQKITVDTKLVLGLALYKSGKEDSFAGSGKDEWQKNCDVIKRQAEFAKQNNFCGVCLYSASFVNFNETSSGKETKNFCDVVL